MSAEDALFRSLRPIAESLVSTTHRNGVPLDLDQLTEQVLNALRPVIDLAPYERELRTRVRALLQERASSFVLAFEG